MVQGDKRTGTGLDQYVSKCIWQLWRDVAVSLKTCLKAWFARNNFQLHLQTKNLWGDRCGWLNLDLQQVTMVRSCYPAIFYHLLSASKVLVHRPSQVGSKTLNSPTVHRFRLAHLWKGLNIVLETGQRFATGRWGQISHGCSLCLMAWAWVMAVVACLHENVWDAWACIFEVQSVVTDPLHR